LLTEIPGSSSVFERGFVTYSNAAKVAQLGVRSALIKQHGAVNAPVAKAMAEGALKHSKADIAVAVTGIAGPAGGTKARPVGLVYIAVVGGKGRVVVKKCHFRGGRSAVRLSAVREAISLLTARLVHSS
jgi:nicotinamide-nucleotide amidase